jgi:hypothetical protein
VLLIFFSPLGGLWRYACKIEVEKIPIVRLVLKPHFSFIFFPFVSVREKRSVGVWGTAVEESYTMYQI